MNRWTLCAIFAVLCGGIASAKTTTHVYKLTMSQQVPRIYDNMSSQGYRKYQTQRLYGYLSISFHDDGSSPDVFITSLYNKTHKINGQYITYKTTVDNEGDILFPRVNLIGNNKTGKFKTASICFYADAEPSYNIGLDNEDNSLLCTFAGKGSVKAKTVKAWQEYTYTDAKGKQHKGKRLVTLGKYEIIYTLRGYDAGTLGCGCYAYGHVSPTRRAGALAPTDQVDDVAATYGTWRATYVESLIADE